MRELLKTYYNITDADISSLDGYENKNYLITGSSGKTVLKTYPFNQELYDVLIAESEILNALASANEFQVPIPIKTYENKLVALEDNGEDKFIFRMISFVEGQLLGKVTMTSKLAQSLGRNLALLNTKLKGLDSYILKSREWNWDNQYFLLNKKLLSAIPDPHDRAIIEHFMLQFEEHVSPIASELRKQIIHGDINEWNLMTQNDQLTGFLDFGDLCYSFLINELAIALAYTCYKENDPLKWITDIIMSYNEIIPLEEKEVNILYYLIAARLCTSVCNSAFQRITNPENEYAASSERPAWNTLHKWLAINPRYFEDLCRKALKLKTNFNKENTSTINLRKRYLSQTLSVSYDSPIEMIGGAFQYMYDKEGICYLDAYNNIPHVGHQHPRIVRAAAHQMTRLNTNTRYLYDELGEYAEKLLSYFPNKLNKVLFVNSGSAATDLALRIARLHSDKNGTLVSEYGYHGNTQSAIEISHYKYSQHNGPEKSKDVTALSLPDLYRSKFTTDLEASGEYIKEAISIIQNINYPIGTFIIEPIIGCGGQIPLPLNYLKSIYPLIRDQGGVCISDEVQTGFGRLGESFWGFQLQDVIPDIVILGKPMANGHPMGAVVFTEELSKSFEKGVEFFSSFGGNPVSCRIASEVLDVLEEEELQQSAQQTGTYYLNQLKILMEEYPEIGDIRGSGLFVGIEIINPQNKEPDQVLAKRIINLMRERGILLSIDGPFKNVIKSKPPLCFNKQNVDRLIVEFAHSLDILAIK